MITYTCPKCGISSERSICGKCGGRTDAESHLYWCPTCKVPLYGKNCENCGQEGVEFAADVRPVFPEERLLIEVLLGKPLAFIDGSVWASAGDRYYVDGKKIVFSTIKHSEADADEVRRQWNEWSSRNNYEAFDRYAESFIRANRTRLDYIEMEAMQYIQEAAKGFDAGTMFVSFSGGKDSTVVSDLVMRALGRSDVLHIFGNTTLEFPQTIDYVSEFREDHPTTPVLRAENRQQDFYTLCELFGPPSRMLRWCCTIFKTGYIGDKIKRTFADSKQVLVFNGIRRNESTSRSKYDRDNTSPKISKQKTASPIIDWFDFDTEIDKLCELQVLTKRDTSNEYAFLTANGVDIKNSVKNYVATKLSSIKVCVELENCIGRDYVLPRQYNNTHKIIRYFRRAFMDAGLFCLYDDGLEMLLDQSADGVIVQIVAYSQEERDRIMAHYLQMENTDCVLLAINNEDFSLEPKLKELAAIQALKQGETAWADAHYAEELDVYEEDVLRYINPDVMKELATAYATAQHFLQQTFDMLCPRYIYYAQKAGLHANDQEKLKEYLSSSVETNSEAFGVVNSVYRELNGQDIQWDSGISAGEVLSFLSKRFIEERHVFDRIIVLFDEFGRYIEYAAQNPNIAGDSALQQIFEAVQNGKGKILHIAFIQSELSAYLSRIEKTSNISRYVGRYDTSDKYYLSSNFETILANLILKKDCEC